MIDGKQECISWPGTETGYEQMVYSADALNLYGPWMQLAKAERERDLVQGIHLLLPPKIWAWNEVTLENCLTAATHLTYNSRSGTWAEGDFIWTDLWFPV